MSDIGPDTDLSPQAVQVLAGWLRRQEGMQAPPGGAPGVPELVLYLCGALPPGETFAIEERLLATKSGLRQLRVVRTELLRLEAMPWQAENRARMRCSMGEFMAARMRHRDPARMPHPWGEIGISA